MRNIMRIASAVAATVLVSAGAVARGADEKLPLDKLPGVVSRAVQAKFPKAEMQAAEKEVEGGKTTYEVTIRLDGVKIDVDVTAAGVVTGYEKAVKLADLPKPVAEAVAAKYPQGKPESAEVVYKVAGGKDAIAYYEVMVSAGGKTMEVEILANGQMKPAEKKEAKDG